MIKDSKILSRIVSGIYKFKYNNYNLKLIYPSVQIKYEADILYSEVYDENKFEDWLTLETAKSVLIDNGVWHSTSDQQLYALEKEIEQAKINLFLSISNPIQQIGHRNKLKELNKKYYKYYNIRHSLDGCTLEAYCDYHKNFFLLSKSLFDDYGGNYISTNKYDYHTYQNIVSIISDSNIETTTFRKLARSDSWKNYWSSGRGDVFMRPSIELTDEQRALIVYTKMYESARESTESPPDFVFDDDDMFDGWLSHQHQKQEESKKDVKTGSNSKMDNAQEMFIMANDTQQASKIHNMNTGRNKNIISSRNKAIQKNKEMNASQLPDTKQEIQLRQNQSVTKRMKG